MAPQVLLPTRQALKSLLVCQRHLSRRSSRVFFDLRLYGSRAGLCRLSLRRTARRLLQAVDFYFGQFSFFSAQIDGVDDFISFTAHPTIRKQFLARVWWNQKSA
jgi:hypothetical protein